MRRDGSSSRGAERRGAPRRPGTDIGARWIAALRSRRWGEGLSPTAIASRLTLVCQGASAATRAVAFPSPSDALEPRALDALPRLGWYDRAITAPAVAARDTALALAPTADPEPALRDCDYGAWSGRPMTAVEADSPDAFAQWLGDPRAAPDGGESLAQVLSRVKDWLDRSAAVPANRLAVTSPFIVRAAVVAALDLPLPVFWRLDAAPLRVTRLTAQNGRWRLTSFNAAS